jgi:hypothetical protein
MVAVKYVVVGVVVVVVVVALVLILHTAHQVPVQYVGSPNGFNGFVPSGQTVSYKGSQDPVGDLILNNGTTLPNVIWNGQYASTIIQIHNQIVQLNNQFVGQTDPVNNQPYVTLQDVYVIEGLVPIENATINGQVYYMIEANKINPANIAGFYTYQGWMNKFIAAINIPGTTGAVLLEGSSVFTWQNITGIVAYQTMMYGGYGPFTGRFVLVLPNGTIIPYGITSNLCGVALYRFDFSQQVYNLPS